MIDLARARRVLDSLLSDPHEDRLLAFAEDPSLWAYVAAVVAAEKRLRVAILQHAPSCAERCNACSACLLRAEAGSERGRASLSAILWTINLVGWGMCVLVGAMGWAP